MSKPIIIENKEDIEHELRIAAKMIQRISEKLHRSVTISNLYFAYTPQEDMSVVTCYIDVDRDSLLAKGVTKLNFPLSVKADSMDDIKGILSQLELLENIKVQEIRKDEE